MTAQIPDWLQHLLRRPVAIFGDGVSGRAAAGLVTALGGRSRIYDRRSEVAQQRGFGVVEASEHGLVVTSPGFAPDHPWIRTARSAGCEVLCELDLGALAWPGEVIAVTGTNGKTTVCELLGHALRLAGRDVQVVGNIGRAFCDAWRGSPDAASVAVCEVSSFQAEALRFFEADLTAWTNFAEDHLERHGSLEAYYRAKFNLVKRTRGRRVFYGPSVRRHASELALELPVEGAVDDDLAPAVLEKLASTVFASVPQRENFLLIQALWEAMGLDEGILLRAAKTFRLGRHRLQCTDDVRGVRFWNDSKATNFHAAEAALARFAEPVLWILGGRSKGGDLAGFINRASPHVKRAFVLGETANELERLLRGCAVPVARCVSMRDAVQRAFSCASGGDNVVLSPGFASFDMFQSYEDRGCQFEAAVAELAATNRAHPSDARSHTTNRPKAMGFSIL